MKTNGFKPYILNTLLSVGLCCAYALVGGGISLLIGMLISALLGVVFYREHYGLGIANSILVLVVLMLFLSPIPALTSGIPLVLLSLALSIGNRVKLNVYLMILLCSVLFMADIAVSMELMESMSGGELSFNAIMMEAGNMFGEAMGQQYADTETAEMVEEAMRVMVDVSIMLAPAIFMMVSTVLGYVLIVIYKKVQQKYGTDMSFWLPFECLQSDKVMAFLYLILLLLMMIAPEGLFLDMATNVFLLLSFLFVIIGASVFDYKMKQRGIAKFLRCFIIVGMLAVSTSAFLIPALVLLICGLTDSFRDYRHLQVKKEEE